MIVRLHHRLTTVLYTTTTTTVTISILIVASTRAGTLSSVPSTTAIRLVIRTIIVIRSDHDGCSTARSTARKRPFQGDTHLKEMKEDGVGVGGREGGDGGVVNDGT